MDLHADFRHFGRTLLLVLLFTLDIATIESHRSYFQYAWSKGIVTSGPGGFTVSPTNSTSAPTTAAPATAAPTTAAPTTVAPTAAPTTAAPTTAAPTTAAPTAAPTTAAPTTAAPTTAATTTVATTTTQATTTTTRASPLPTLTPVPLIDPRIGLEKLNDVEFIRYGNDGTIQEDAAGFTDADAIKFPRNKRATDDKHKVLVKRSDPLPSITASITPSATSVSLSIASSCGCNPLNLCPPDGTQLIDPRIVIGGGGTVSPTCIVGYKFCCLGSTTTPQLSCGSRLQTSVIYPTLTGQARYGDYPWMAMLMALDNTYVGGGVLIDSQHVLTVAHRITNYPNGANLKVRLGEWDLSANYEQYPYRDSSISRVFIHESYNPTTLQNDIAVIRMSTALTSGTPAVIPICMPAAQQQFDGLRCWVSGWGKDAFGTTGQFQSILKVTDVPILGAASCESTLRTTRLGSAYVLDRASFICAGGEANKDSCTGDGGSGLVCETSPGRWVLAGLVAWGLGCASQGVPAAYVNIANYLSWIQSRQSAA